MFFVDEWAGTHFVVRDTNNGRYYGYFFRHRDAAETVAASESFGWRPGWHTYGEMIERYEINAQPQ